MIESGLLLMRLLVGLTLFVHGARNLLNPAHYRSQVDQLGLRPRSLWIFPARFMKTVGGALLALGFATPVGGSLIFSSMLMAALSKKSKGFWNFHGGYEYPLTLSLMAGILSFTGAGEYSLDHAWGLQRLFEQPRFSLALLVVALIVVLTGWVTRRAAPPPDRRHTPGSGGNSGRPLRST